MLSTGDRVQLLVLVPLVAFLVYQVITPLGFLVWGSFKTVRPGAPGFFDPTLTFSNYWRALADPQFVTSLLNTVLYTGATALGTLLVGTLLAWITTRTDAPGRAVIAGLAFAGLTVPGIIMTVSWILLASPNTGFINVAARSLGLGETLFDIYTLPGMIWVSVWQFLPLAYLLLSAAFQSMDPSLEEASAIAGRGTIRTLRRVTLPLVLPSLLAIVVLLLIYGIEAFETPALLGIPGKVFVFSTLVYLNTSFAPSDIGLASAYAMFLLALSLAALAGYLRLTRRERAFVTITGKGFRPRRLPLGAWRLPLSAIGILIVLVGVALPLLTLVWTSFLRFLQPPSMAALQSLNFANYQTVLGNDGMRTAVLNSVVLGVGSATLTLALVTPIAWIVARTRLPGRQGLDMLAFAPIAIPGIVLSISMIWLYLSLPLPVYGTIWIILLAYLIKYMPVVMRIVSASVAQVHPEMEEASMLCATWSRTMRRVALPLLRPGLLAAWIWVASNSFREVTVAVMLANQDTRPVGVAMFALWNDGRFGMVAAFAVIILVVLSALSAAALWVGRRYRVIGA
jgi:iron(III) transport system permease protein